MVLADASDYVPEVSRCGEARSGACVIATLVCSTYLGSGCGSIRNSQGIPDIAKTLPSEVPLHTVKVNPNEDATSHRSYADQTLELQPSHPVGGLL